MTVPFPLPQHLASPTASAAKGRPTWASVPLFVLALCSTAFFLAYHVFGGMVPTDFYGTMTRVYEPMLVCQTAAVVLALLRRRPLGARLLACSLVWLVVTRVVLGDDVAASGGVCECALLYGALFAYPACLPHRMGRWLMALVTVALAVILGIWAVAGTYTALTGGVFAGAYRVAISVEVLTPPLVFVRFPWLFRNISASLFVMALGLLLYWCADSQDGAAHEASAMHARVRRWFWRVTTALFVPLASLGVAMQRCRSCYAAFALVLVCGVNLLLWRRPSAPAHGTGTVPNAHRLVVVRVLVSLVCLALMYRGLGLGADALLRRAQVQAERELAAQATEVPGASQDAENKDAADNHAAQLPAAASELSPERRGTTWNTTTLAGRTHLWAEVLPTLCENPQILLFGQHQDHLMDAINERVSWPEGMQTPVFPHMHNMLLQHLMLGGAVGLLIILGFAASLVRDTLHCLRRLSEPRMRQVAALGISVVSMLLYGMLEPLLAKVLAASLLFALVAGFFACEAEVGPSEQGWDGRLLHVLARNWQVACALVALWVAAVFVFLFLHNAALALVVAAVLSVATVAARLAPEHARRVAEASFRNRWAIALVVFCACVCLRIHGSSIGVYDEVLPTQVTQESTTLFGEPRWVRSDEFGVQTPTFFSQAHNSFGMYSTRMGLSATNMVLDYYAPVWDVTILGKPLAWGYLLFGNEVGLSWYWCGQAVLMFMTALEMCLVLTRGRRLAAVAGAVLVGLSPAIQWWFLPHMPILVMYAMGLFVLGYHFFAASRRWHKWLLAALGAQAIVGYCLSIFPSFQVPCAIVVVALLAACLARDRERLAFGTEDLAPLALMLLASGGIVGRFVLSSQEDLAALMGTVYPGGRVSQGGGWVPFDLFTNPASLFFPFRDETVTNNCEASTYVHAAPLVLALSPAMLWRMRAKGNRNALVGGVFVAILLVQAYFMVVGVPRLVAELTPLRFCNRMNGVYGWVATLFTVWGFSALAERPDLLRRWERVVWPVAFVAATALLMSDASRSYFAGIRAAGLPAGYVLLALALAAGCVVVLLALGGRTRLAVALVGVAMLLAGATVNPVERGIGAIENHPITQTARRIAEEEPDALWLCADVGSQSGANLFMACGARVLNATSFYPDAEKWAIIDPAGRYRNTTNRYANQQLSLVEDATSLELLGDDLIQVFLSPQTVRDLGVRYLVCRADRTSLLAAGGIACEEVCAQDGWRLYALSYGEGE